LHSRQTVLLLVCDPRTVPPNFLCSGPRPKWVTLNRRDKKTGPGDKTPGPFFIQPTTKPIKTREPRLYLNSIFSHRLHRLHRFKEQKRRTVFGTSETQGFAERKRNENVPDHSLTQNMHPHNKATTKLLFNLCNLCNLWAIICLL